MKRRFKGKRIGLKGFVRASDQAIVLIKIRYDRSKIDWSQKHGRYTTCCYIDGIRLVKTGKYIPSVFGFSATGKPFTYKSGTYIENENIFFYPAYMKRAEEYALSFAKGVKERHKIIHAIFGDVKPPKEPLK